MEILASLQPIKANQRCKILGDELFHCFIAHCLVSVDSCNHAEMAYEAN